jgi:hypothetical protein
MQKFTASVLINRSQQDVFDFLSNAANYQQCNQERGHPMANQVSVQPSRE